MLNGVRLRLNTFPEWYMVRNCGEIFGQRLLDEMQKDAFFGDKYRIFGKGKGYDDAILRVALETRLSVN